jgi:hypothetical protein
MADSADTPDYAKQKVVWVLGTGFSVPLGGPMLKDLLSLGLHSELEAKYHLDTPAMRDLLRLYHYGRMFPEGKVGLDDHERKGSILWEHAEDFLDVLDTYDETNSTAGQDRFRAILNPYHLGTNPATIREILLAAKQHIAAEVCAFLDRNRDATERWRPYLGWAKNLLRPLDTIVTFNYDCVLEVLNEKLDSESQHIDVLDSAGMAEWASIKKARALKLHGSVNWIVNDDGKGGVRYDKSKEYEHAVKAPLERTILATPGPGKFRARTALAKWWQKATEAIRHADAIVFMGYRFPPSDSDARSELIGALVENKTPNLLNIHAVLGPDQNNDTARLEHMIRYAMARARRKAAKEDEKPPDGDSYFLQMNRLYSQDFMSLANRAQLFAPGSLVDGEVLT